MCRKLGGNFTADNLSAALRRSQGQSVVRAGVSLMSSPQSQASWSSPRGGGEGRSATEPTAGGGGGGGGGSFSRTATAMYGTAHSRGRAKKAPADVRALQRCGPTTRHLVSSNFSTHPTANIRFHSHTVSSLIKHVYVARDPYTTAARWGGIERRGRGGFRRRPWRRGGDVAGGSQSA